MSDELRVSAADENASTVQKAIFDYLTENVAEFRTLSEWREKVSGALESKFLSRTN